MVVHPSVPARTVKELVALTKARPSTLNYASSGAGSAGHMTAELFKSVTGTRIEHVPYKGAGSVITDLVGGYVQMMFSGPGSVIPLINQGRLRPLAVAYSRRTAGLDNVPTFAEAGFPAVDATQWYGVVAPVGTPKDIVARLNAEIRKIMQSKEMLERLNTEGAISAAGTPEQFDAYIKSEIARWGAVVKAAGMKAD